MILENPRFSWVYSDHWAETSLRGYLFDGIERPRYGVRTIAPSNRMGRQQGLPLASTCGRKAEPRSSTQMQVNGRPRDRDWAVNRLLAYRARGHPADDNKGAHDYPSGAAPGIWRPAFGNRKIGGMSDLPRYATGLVTAHPAALGLPRFPAAGPGARCPCRAGTFARPSPRPTIRCPRRGCARARSASSLSSYSAQRPRHRLGHGLRVPDSPLRASQAGPVFRAAGARAGGGYGEAENHLRSTRSGKSGASARASP